MLNDYLSAIAAARRICRNKFDYILCANPVIIIAGSDDLLSPLDWDRILDVYDAALKEYGV